MSHPLRIEFPGAWYHVMNRVRRSKAIFLEKEDYSEFLDLHTRVSKLTKFDRKFRQQIEEINIKISKGQM